MREIHAAVDCCGPASVLKVDWRQHITRCFAPFSSSSTTFYTDQSVACLITTCLIINPGIGTMTFEQDRRCSPKYRGLRCFLFLSWSFFHDFERTKARGYSPSGLHIMGRAVVANVSLMILCLLWLKSALSSHVAFDPGFDGLDHLLKDRDHGIFVPWGNVKRVKFP